jgi:hypothetical protein
MGSDGEADAAITGWNAGPRRAALTVNVASLASPARMAGGGGGNAF